MLSLARGASGATVALTRISALSQRTRVSVEQGNGTCFRDSETFAD